MCEKYETDVNEIIPNLWLGNYKAAYDKSFLQKYNIKYILTIMEDFNIKYKYDTITYLNIPVKDKDTCVKNLIQLFNTTGEFINNALMKRTGVLIHCKKGHHRSASVVAAFLIKYLNIDHVSAVLYINYLRPCALKRNTCMTNGLFRYYQHINNC